MNTTEVADRLQRVLKTVVQDHLAIETGLEPRFMGTREMPYGIALMFEAPVSARNDALRSSPRFEVEIRIAVRTRS